jgi:hypothetical protein
VHQIIGPTWEYAIGLSDPSEWDSTLGLLGDPAQLLGAFQDSFNDWHTYTPETAPGEILLRDTEGSISKSFSISSDQIHVNLENTPQFQAIPIPLAIDPWIRYTENWGSKYLGSLEGTSYTWGIDSRIEVKISTTGRLEAYAFNDTLSMMSQP